jgi:hypothetical protein
MNYVGKIFLLVLFTATPAFAQDRVSVIQSLFLIGDAGEYYLSADPIGKALQTKINEAAGKATVLYLGDNVYPRGLPNAGERLRNQGEFILRTQIEWLNGTQAKGIFIPGNHDWHHWGRKGHQYILNQQHWLDSLKNENIMLLPRDGCPGPVEIPLGDKTALVIIDTQWFLHQWDKPGEDSSCDAKTTEEVLTQLSDIFYRNRNRTVILAGHHPLITYGEHGGVFPFRSHLFPLTDLSHGLYIPMPVIGSIYPLYRKWIGHIQDTAHPINKAFSNAIQKIMAQYTGSIYVAGHEHALQYITKDSSHFIVSGSGAKTEMVKKKGYAEFADDVRGFVQLDILSDGAVTAHFYHTNEKSGELKEVFTKHINFSKKVEASSRLPIIDFNNYTVKVNASDLYEASRTKKKLLGKNYRSAWKQEIEVPVFNIRKEKGGLTIIQRGGGQQTLSLRLEDSTGHEYVLRSVEKYPEKAIPEIFRKTFAQDLVQDQISASHPYAALVVATLAEAVGIYHTNPHLVYIPNDPALGEYQQMFANTLALFEERPAGDWSEAPHFGNSKKIINTTKVLEKLAEDNDNQVDQEFVLKSRLFDLIIGDWDRHDDQWRWATLKGKKGDIFKPIPRDRDQAFFVNEGKLSKIWSRKWALPKFEGFDDDIDWPSGLSFNARYFDRTFLTALSKEKWIKTANEIQQDLTDEIIEEAIRQWPPEIYTLHGERIIKTLKYRRNKLHHYAASHYEFLARETEVVGSDKNELFEIERLTNGDTHVSVFKINKEGKSEKKIYDRIFRVTETKEIRLYGLDGDDHFIISGKAKRTSLLRIIGGKGQDTVLDSSSVGGLLKKTYFYDSPHDATIITGKEVNDKSSTDPEVNTYNRKAFQYNRMAPLLYGNYNIDDGLFIGGGFITIKHGFRKTPFKQRHLFLASIAPQTLSFNFHYQGKFREVIGKWGLEILTDLKAPNYVNNFFGMGNESHFNKDIGNQSGIEVSIPIQYYRYRFEEWRSELVFTRKFGNYLFLKAGPAWQRIEMEEPKAGEDRFINEYASSLPYNLFNEYNSFAGLTWQVDVDKRDNTLLTTKGVTWNVTGRNMNGISSDTYNFSSYESTLAFYQSFRFPARVVFALRIGGGINTGRYNFYQAQILDGKTEIRGFRKTRFYGDSKLYSNIEVRIKLLSFRSYLFPATLGISAFQDTGRVWYKNENGVDPSAANGFSHQWHSGWGGGVWFTPFNFTVLSTEMAYSTEGTLLYVRLGFLF